MLVSPILSANYQNIKSNNITSPIKFRGTEIKENFIVDDINDFEFPDKNISNALRENLNNLECSQTTINKDFKNFSLYKNKQKILDIEYNKNHDNLKFGFAIGKAGLYSTVEIPDKNGGSYVVILPENSELKTENGLHIKCGARKNSPSFTGRQSSATVNVYYKPEKTKNSVEKFVENQEESNIFNGIEKKDYSDGYHPYILAGGFGTRLEVLSHQRGDNKPSTATPVKDWDLMHFNLLNLHRVNLLDDSTEISYNTQKSPSGSAGCFIEALGYEIKKTDDGIDLVKTRKSLLPKDKKALIVTADNITDMDYSKFLEVCNEKDDLGMMIVGIPVSEDMGGLIERDEHKVVKRFIEKPNNTTDLENTVILDEKGEIYRDRKGRPCYLGNAFIHIINPDIYDDLANIYRDKIKTSYTQAIKDTEVITDEKYSQITEGIWGRDFIPELIKRSEEGTLLDRNGKNLKIYTYEALDNDWDDVGNYNKYYNTVRNSAKEDYFVNLPVEIKKNIAKNIDDNIIYNVDVKDQFKEFLGNGYVKGNVIITPKE